MKHKFLLFVVLATMLVSTADAIVPQPVSYKQNNGAFVIKPSTTISYTDDCLRPLVVYMLDYIPFKNVSRTAVEDNVIILSTDSAMQPEEYVLTVEGTRIEIRGGG